jgi:hypothetical protein
MGHLESGNGELGAGREVERRAEKKNAEGIYSGWARLGPKFFFSKKLL